MAELITNVPLDASLCAEELVENIQQCSLHTIFQPVTLILDLDETLIHSSLERPEFYSFAIDVPFDGKMVPVYVRIRPGAFDFVKKLCEMGKIFDVFIFTASVGEYAVPVVQHIWPWFPSNRILTRQYCRVLKYASKSMANVSEGSSEKVVVVKDLSIFQRNLQRMILVDNSIESFLLQKENGILVSSWIGDFSDTVLVNELLPFLLKCAAAEDVRKIIASAFGGGCDAESV